MACNHAPANQHGGFSVYPLGMARSPIPDRPPRRAMTLRGALIPGWTLRRSVTDCLDVVPIGIEHESTVVIRMVVRAKARGAIVLSPCRERRTVERIDRRPILREDRDVHRLVQLTFAADPQVRFATAAETGGRLLALRSGHLHNQRVAKRRQRLFVKGPCPRVVRHRKSYVIDHDALR